jgi:TetR/AcrR family transcriptional regulator
LKNTTRKRAPAAKGLGPNAKDAILAAALRSFARDGFDGASLPKIAELAGVAHPLIHYHFGSKDNLWRQTIEYYLGDLSRQAAALQTASRGLPPLNRLRVLLLGVTHFAARCPDHFAMIMAEARSDSERYSWLQEHYGSAFVGHLKSILKDAQKAGQLRKAPLDELASILLGAVLLYFTVNPRLRKDVSNEQLADGFADLLLDMFLNGLAVKSPAAKATTSRASARKARA